MPLKLKTMHLSTRPISPVQSQAPPRLKIVIIGLTITSSWGNGHATTYRGLVRELVRRGHEVLFLEHDKPWYASHRDLPNPPFGRTALYPTIEELRQRFAGEVASADLVIVGSYVPQGVEVGRWVMRTARGMRAFYDIDTPVTLAKLQRGDFEYLSPELIREYDLYLSFTGGPTLAHIERHYGSPRALPLYCSVDPEIYHPETVRATGERGSCRAAASLQVNGSAGASPSPPARWDLGYLGTYSADRQPPLERLMLEAARRWLEGRFVVAGPQYPPEVAWPGNVQRIDHLPPAEHCGFYNAQRFTLNITRSDMIRAGYSPSVRLFEAAACGVPIISDYWDGLDSFFRLGDEILVARDADDVLRFLRDTDEPHRRRVGQAARQRVLASHTAAHRAAELESYMLEFSHRE